MVQVYYSTANWITKDNSANEIILTDLVVDSSATVFGLYVNSGSSYLITYSAAV